LYFLTLFISAVSHFMISGKYLITSVVTGKVGEFCLARPVFWFWPQLTGLSCV